MAAVWEHSSQKEGALLVLLALADCAHDDGTMAFPSVKTLAEKARMSERNARYCQRTLERSGEIVRQGQHASGTTLYRIVLPSKGGQELPGENFAGGGNLAQKKCRKLPPNRKEPSIPPLTPNGVTPPKEKQTRRTQVDPGFGPDAKGIAFATARGWDAGRIEFETERFVAHHEKVGSLMASWPAAWRTWVLNGVKFDARDAGRRPTNGRTTQADLNRGGTGKVVV
jgi:hypothetical protein